MDIWSSILISSLKTLPYGKLLVILPNGKSFNFSGYKKGPYAELRIKEHKSIKRIMKNGSIGFAEEFIAKNIITKNL